MSIKSAAGPWNKSRVEGYVLIASIGVLAEGRSSRCAERRCTCRDTRRRTGLTLILAARLSVPPQRSATVGALSTVITTLLLGGRLAGGVAATPLVLFAGIVLDFGAYMVEQNPAAIWRAVLILAAAGTAGANLFCFIKRLFEPVGTFFSTANLHDLATAAGWHAFFGLIAGLLAAAIALAKMRRAAADSSDRQ